MENCQITVCKNGLSNHFEFPIEKNLSEVLNAENSPLLFGCRTGLCGTCLIKVKKGPKESFETSNEENEIIEVCHGSLEKGIRLACQLKLKGNTEIEVIG